jgi:hypothetical protein
VLQRSVLGTGSGGIQYSRPVPDVRVIGALWPQTHTITVKATSSLTGLVDQSEQRRKRDWPTVGNSRTIVPDPRESAAGAQRSESATASGRKTRRGNGGQGNDDV